MGVVLNVGEKWGGTLFHLQSYVNDFFEGAGEKFGGKGKRCSLIFSASPKKIVNCIAVDHASDQLLSRSSRHIS